MHSRQRFPPYFADAGSAFHRQPPCMLGALPAASGADSTATKAFSVPLFEMMRVAPSVALEAGKARCNAEHARQTTT